MAIHPGDLPDIGGSQSLVTLEPGGEQFASSRDETILRAGLRAGLGLSYECHSGSCGSCQMEILAGKTTDLWPQAPGLSARARESGRRLACQTQALSNCRVKMHTRDKYLPPIRPTRQPALLRSREYVTPDMALFRFESPDPADFLPGQYALLRLPGVDGDRAYSMSNLPNPEGIWEFVIKRQPGGAAGGALFGQLQPGTAVELDGPYGNAYLREDSGREIICIGGGSGISPLLAILAGAADSLRFQGRKLSLLYGGRRTGDICAPALLRRKQLQDRVTCVNAVSDEAGKNIWPGHRGPVHEVLTTVLVEHPNPRHCDYYFCGPAPMVDAVYKLLLLEHKVTTSQLHFDRFF